jgi:hypothetical protein
MPTSTASVLVRKRLSIQSNAVASIVAIALSSGMEPASAGDPVVALAAKLAGTWNEAMRAQPSCDDRKYFHTFSLSSDGLILTKRYLVPYEGNFGLVSEERYRVVYANGSSFVLFREGETFENRETGDKVLRQLILETENTYAWRMYGMPREHRAALGGVRCIK